MLLHRKFYAQKSYVETIEQGVLVTCLVLPPDACDTQQLHDALLKLFHTRMGSDKETERLKRPHSYAHLKYDNVGRFLGGWAQVMLVKLIFDSPLFYDVCIPTHL